MINTIFNYEHFLVYLAGPIQYAKDGGVSWREQVTEQMVDIGIKESHILNPCNKPLNNFAGDDLDSNIEFLDKLRDEDRWDEIERIAKHTIRIDLRLVDKSDLLYIHLNPTIPTVGTIDEISIACGQKKPIIVVIPGGLKNASYWLLGRIGSKSIFASDEDAISYLNDVMHGRRVIDAKKWLFFDMKEKSDG